MNRLLIVVDMQNDFVYGSLGSEAAQAIVPNVMRKAYQYSFDEVIFTRDTHFPTYFETLEGQKLPIEHCIVDTKGWEIIDELKSFSEYPDVKIINKYTFGYNNWKNLEGVLATREIDEIEIVGLCSDICIVSNALILKAQFPNVKITVDASCCAGTTPEAHAAALTVMKSCQIDVIGE